MPGKKPLLLLTQNGRGPGKDSAGRALPTTHLDRAVPDKPDDLSPEASAEWDRLVDGSGIRAWLKASDRAALANLCETWSEIVRLRKYLRKNGFKYRTTVRDSSGAVTTKYAERPEVKIYRGLLTEHRYLATAFGLTPTAETGAARATAATEAPSDLANPFAGGSR
ncbi:P27 family phage terminase small subunit [Rhodococcus kroppenstedtii]|uniref:P27 family phage terminase small subunit n=1 Tax=Rhodococcoides kroppenstedtii TaxID=293050 RepID=UPI002952A228|nr:P27 family phage terminase small subunit [Rhodococcus kroppenstedtii]MDV7198100.1 P27 family phage terminase small subunit [Rhodococcus kroppenstedtii]